MDRAGQAGGASGSFLEGSSSSSAANSTNMADLFGKFSRAIMGPGGRRPMEKKRLMVKEAMPLLLEVEVRGDGAAAARGGGGGASSMTMAEDSRGGAGLVCVGDEDGEAGGHVGRDS